MLIIHTHCVGDSKLLVKTQDPIKLEILAFSPDSVPPHLAKPINLHKITIKLAIKTMVH